MANTARRLVERVSGRAAANTVWAAQGSCVVEVLRWSWNRGGGFIASSRGVAKLSHTEAVPPTGYPLLWPFVVSLMQPKD